MRAPRRLCMVGVSGLGKTTLLRALAPRLPTYRCLTGSTLLRELCGDEFPRFDHLPEARKHELREAAIRRMVQIQDESGSHLLCEGHTTLRSRASGLVEPVFTAEDCAFFRELILLHAPVSLVSARRQADVTRQRPSAEAIVHEEMAAEAVECHRIAEQHGLRLHQLDVSDPALEEQLLRLLMEDA